MQLRCLGAFGLEGFDIALRKPLLLVAYVAIEGRQPRGRIAALFWPDATDPRNRLSVALSRIRQQAPGVIDADADSVRAVVATDVGAFAAALERGDWRRAAELHGDGFLEGEAFPGISEELETWIVETRESLAEKLRHALLEVADAAVAVGRFDEAARMTEAALAVPGATPLDPARLRRVHALLQAGDSPASAKVRDDADSLGIEVAGSRAQARAHLLGEVPPSNLPRQATSFVGRGRERAEVGAALARDGSALITLLGPGGIGKTRLALAVAKDQLASRRFPGGVYAAWLDGIDDPAAIPGAIAAAVRAVPKRGEELLAAVIRTVGRRRVLMVLDNFEHVVDGAPVVRDLLSACPNLRIVVTSRVTLGIPDASIVRVQGLPVEPADAEVTAVSEAERLFLDRARNADMSFAPDAHDRMAVRSICEMVGGAPLGIELAASGVRDARPTEIERDLRGALAALRSPLRNVPERHRSLLASFERSWDRLSAPDRAALRRLSIFRGGFDAAAARLVGGATRSQLTRLVNRSLLVAEAEDASRPRGRPDRSARAGVDRRRPEPTRPRYDMHPVVRHFARQRLDVDPDEALRFRRRHTRWCRLLVRREDAKYIGPEQLAAQASLERNRSNLNAALERTTGGDRARDVAAALDLVGRLELFWRYSGSFMEGRAWTERVLAEAGEAAVGGEVRWPSLAARAAAAAASMTLRTGDVAGARRHAQAALRLAEACSGHPSDGAASGSVRVAPRLASGEVAHADERVADAIRNFGAALDAAGRAGDERGRIAAHLGLGDAYLQRKEFEDAAANFRAALAIAERRRAGAAIAAAQYGLGEVARDRTDWFDAEPHFEASLEHAAELGDRWSVARILGELGGVPYHRQQYDRAAERYRDSLDIYRALGDVLGVAKAHFQIGLCAKLSGRWDDALEHHLTSLRMRLEQGAGQVVETNLWAMATLTTAMGHPEIAARFWGAKAAAAEGREYVWADLAKENYARDIAQTRAGLSAEAFDRAFEAGYQARIEDLVEACVAQLGVDHDA